MSGACLALRRLAIAANVLYILWIVRNGVNEGFRGSTVEIVSLAGLVLLLGLNAVLLFRRRR